MKDTFIKTKIPDHLGAEGRRLYSAVLSEYGIDDAPGLALLEVAAAAADRIAMAREVVARDGLVVATSTGNIRAHPILAVEKQAKTQLLQALKELHLDVEIPMRQGRPTKAIGWRG